jgi:hypothetical protein
LGPRSVACPFPMTAGAARRPAAWPVLAVAFRGAARIRPHLPGLFPGPSPSAGLYPLLARGAAGPVTPGDRIGSMAAANAAAASPRSTRPGSTRSKRVSRLAYVRSWRREIGLSLIRPANLFRYTGHPHSGWSACQRWRPARGGCPPAKPDVCRGSRISNIRCDLRHAIVCSSVGGDEFSPRRTRNDDYGARTRDLARRRPSGLSMECGE